MNKHNIAIAAAKAFTLSVLAFSSQAANLVTNGDFSLTTNGPGEFNTTYTQATGWASSGYNFIFAPGTADTTGSYTPQFNGNLQLWGPGNGSANGMPATSPIGGNYVGADGAYEVGAITQTINGLTVGGQYTVGFWWAAAQQYNFNGTTTEQWQVSLGNGTQATAVYDNANHGFSGWMYQTFTYTASNTSEVLSFLAVGTPVGEPPFSLLAGVTMTPTPIPAAAFFVTPALLGVFGLSRRKQKKC